MKLIRCFLILSIAASLAGCVYLRPPDPDSASTVVIAESEQTAGAAFQAVEDRLSRQGYAYRSKDDRLRTLRTEWKPVSGSGIAVRLAVEVLEGEEEGRTETHLWGWYRRSSDEEQTIQHTEQEETAAYRAWTELRRLAGQFPGSVSFETVYEK